MTFYKFITAVVALGTAACAAFFSVVGIATFLGGSFYEVAVMAGFLEAGKLVCASAAYKFRKVAPAWIRVMLVTFTLIMMFITSIGIFGFLSSSYQEAAGDRSISQQKIENVQTRQETFEQKVNRLEEDRERLVATQDRLQNLQAEQGWLTKRQDERMSQIPQRLSEIQSSLASAQDSSLAYQQKVTELQAKNNEDSKLGPIVFVANTVGLPQDQAALYFIVLLMLVFDPMAVTLVVALSMATDLEETVTEEDIGSDQLDTDERIDRMEEVAAIGDEPETGNDGDDRFEDIEYDPVGKKVDLQETLETLRKPLPEKKNVMEKEPIGKAVEIGQVPGSSGLAEAHSPPERADQKTDDPSPETESEGPVDEEDVNTENQRNSEGGETVTETDQGYKRWIEQAQSEEPTVGKEPWKNPFKAPYNS